MEIATKTAEDKFDWLLECALREPVTLLRDGSASHVLLSIEEFQVLAAYSRCAYSTDEAPEWVVEGLADVKIPASTRQFDDERS